MKYYTTGFILLSFSFCLILLLLYFGGLTRQAEKDIDIIKSKIKYLDNKIQVNELEYVAHTSPDYLKKIGQIYLLNKYDDNSKLNIISIEDFKTKNLHKVFKVKEN